MLEVIKYLKARYLSEKAQGIVEYALILAFVLILATALTNPGGIKEKIEAVFKDVSTQLTKRS